MQVSGYPHALSTHGVKELKETKICSNTCTTLLAKCTVTIVIRLRWLWLCEQLRLWVKATTQCY